MTLPTQRHLFLDDLADNVTLVSSILRQPVAGRSAVRQVVKAAASLYLQQSPRFLGTVDGRTFFEYDVALAGGAIASGLVSIERNDNNEVSELHIAFSPLGAVLALAAGVQGLLSAEFAPALFI